MLDFEMLDDEMREVVNMLCTVVRLMCVLTCLLLLWTEPVVGVWASLYTLGLNVWYERGK